MSAKVQKIILLSVVFGLCLFAGLLINNLILRQGEGAGKSLIGGPYQLVNGDGQVVTEKTFQGKFVAYYFGFTSCPDACPTMLTELSVAMEKLGSDADKIVPVFVTVDPERDTPSLVKEYAAAFGPHLVGLSGTNEQIQAITSAFRVYFKKVPSKEGGPMDYTVDHMSVIYLMDREGNFVRHFSHGTNADALAEGFRKALQ